VEIDLGAIRHNTELMARLIAPARLCAVVKADAYGHGAVAVAPVVLDAGASMLAVALVDEGLELRAAGITAPILVLSEPPIDAMHEAVAADLIPAIYQRSGLDAVRAAAAALGRTVGVHVKVDTGMHRVGASPADAVQLCVAIAAAPELRLDGLFSHLAVADIPDDPFTDVQATRFSEVRAELATLGIHPEICHLANSAGAICHPQTRFDMVRSGIVLYGHLSTPECAPALEALLAPGEAIIPAFSLHARVHLVRDLEAGERTSYGRYYALERPSRIALVPLGYHDGVPRALAPAGGEVIIGGVRRPIAGTVTMDQILVDCGDAPVAVGDEVVLIGRQGDAEVTAEEWADTFGSIPHEIFARIGPRVPRRYVGA
jgi:alanine racemase